MADTIDEMAAEPGTRPVCAALTASMLGDLRRGKSSHGLRVRRLSSFGGGLTPMGEQWRTALVENERMRRALDGLREMVQRGATQQELLDAIAGGLG